MLRFKDIVGRIVYVGKEGFERVKSYFQKSMIIQNPSLVDNIGSVDLLSPIMKRRR